MAERKIKWYKIADSMKAIEWNVNNMAVAEAAGKKITLAKPGEQLFACAYKCPHAGGILSDGFIDGGGNIVCPLHRYKYSLQNGRNITGEGYFLKTYFAEVREDGVYIGFEEKNLFGWL